MLEDLYRDAAAVRRLQLCVLGRHLEEFCAHLAGRGYAANTIRLKIGLLGRVARWMETKGLAACDLGERRAEDFVAMRTYSRRRRRDVLQTVLQLIDYLRSSGALPWPEPTLEDSADAVVLARYESYLREERALAPGDGSLIKRHKWMKGSGPRGAPEVLCHHNEAPRSPQRGIIFACFRLRCGSAQRVPSRKRGSGRLSRAAR